MTNKTALANAALALLGEVAISSIDDTDSAAARVCKQFADAAIGETLRLGRWNSATKRVALVRLAETPPADSFAYYYQLPNDCLRVLEINGEEFNGSTEFFEVEDDRIASDEDAVELRYVSNADISKMDPLLQNAVALRLAHKIAIPLSGSPEKSAFMLQMFGKALAEARQVDAQECGSREKSAFARIFSRSRLLRARGRGRNPLRLEDY